MTKNVKRATLVLAMTPLLAAPATAAWAAAATDPVTAPVTTTVAPAGTDTTTTTTTHTDAPPASASAVAAKVDGVITIGETGATAGNGSGTAHAEALDIFGQRVSGGDVKDGKGGGNLFATPPQGDQIGDLELAPWSGSVTHDNGGTQSQAEAALAHAGLLGVLQIWLLHSQSQATWTPDASHGHSSSDVAEANLDNQLDVKVLHSETDSSGKGSSAVLVINDNGVLTSDQTGNQCVIDADPLLKVLCLQAAGGKGSDGTTTATATATAVDVTSQSGLPEIVGSGSKSSGGKVAAPAAATTAHQRGPLPHTSGPSSSKGLPFTGSESAVLAAVGALLAAMGAWVTTVTGRRRSAAVA